MSLAVPLVSVHAPARPFSCDRVSSSPVCSTGIGSSRCRARGGHVSVENIGGAETVCPSVSCVSPCDFHPALSAPTQLSSVPPENDSGWRVKSRQTQPENR